MRNGIMPVRVITLCSYYLRFTLVLLLLANICEEALLGIKVSTLFPVCASGCGCVCVTIMLRSQITLLFSANSEK